MWSGVTAYHSPLIILTFAILYLALSGNNKKGNDLGVRSLMLNWSIYRDLRGLRRRKEDAGTGGLVKLDWVGLDDIVHSNLLLCLYRAPGIQPAWATRCLFLRLLLGCLLGF
jgi:hypothetical protein